MKTNIKKRGDSALSELARTYELVRDELADRLEDVASRIDDLDTRALGNRAYSSAAALREQVEKRAARIQGMRPARRRRSVPWAWLLLGAATLGIAWFLVDSRRRDMVTRLGARTSSAARGAGVSSAVDGVMGRVRGQQGTILDEARLRSDVETAIAAGGGMPDGLQVAVEGRTVYLRGTLQAQEADVAATRAQGVEGVAAVVNLTTAPAGKAAASNSGRA